MQVQDAFPFSIGFSTKEGPICTLSNSALLQKRRPFPSVKIFSLHRTDTFHMEAYYADQNELPSDVSPKISSFMVRLPFEHDFFIVYVNFETSQYYIKSKSCMQVV